MYKEPKTGLWCREDTLDEYVVKEQRCYDLLLDFAKGKVVMDIGGNIGAFAYSAIKHGAKSVISFELDPDNITVFTKQNLDQVKLIKGAIASHNGTATLYLNKGKNKGMHSLQAIGGRETIQVKAYPFKKALTKYSPDLIKIDIEGGEFDLDFKNMPEFIQGIAIEIHLNHGNNREMAPALIKTLRQQFPSVLKTPRITEKNWTTYFIGMRGD